MSDLIRLARKYIYKAGLRPKRGSIFYSPSLSLFYAFRDSFKKR